jgi:hypothetical protein
MRAPELQRDYPSAAESKDTERNRKPDVLPRKMDNEQSQTANYWSEKHRRCETHVLKIIAKSLCLPF